MENTQILSNTDRLLHTHVCEIENYMYVTKLSDDGMCGLFPAGNFPGVAESETAPQALTDMVVGYLKPASVPLSAWNAI